MNGDRAGGGRPLALITGASSGIGYELARLFAEHGHDLVVNAEDERLEHAARRLRETGVEVRAVRADLRTAEGVDRLVAALTGLTVDVAALNAGVGQGGAFVDTDPRDDQSVIDLNVSSTVRLAKPLLRDMVARGVGRLMFTSSVAATMPGSFQSVYNASKSFVQSFAQALQKEVADTGVTVTSFMPGPTETDFFRRAGMTDTKVGTMDKDDPAQVARQAYDAVMKGRGKLVTGSAKTKAQGVADKVLPDRVKAAVHRRMAEPGSATEDGAAAGDGAATEDGGR
ncbi:MULTISPECIES: SDR family NAD(P)-dependent oxidoreductase [Streptomyces]|uniref:SDR family NAD(P)-dependent oxidoreductase n=1 Tax=Streptomyces TaxID=1883 RepID=UPI00031D2756|nr:MULTISPECIES: SDR family NAD(P)-dependent oxidoreductase [Streptomyces]MBQ0878782.1 SDR family NAD(P)-dependent oxidoreductase [Streptomyces sp. RT42]MDI3098230.1 SDR family NAD(P)-dependent oxidoreductase [Streptomyces sp. AN-3]QCR51048.1 KR domain-containing protein [Streptomyces sp. SGAir0924]RSS13135.1 SDR family NAD(P)-dependent oxidoreductase [Streptomyces sp. WAC05458]RSS87964.1 SDR family NAD(P)-dependent oxidoreductase [Streptomyces sp. WAC02707]